MPVSGNAASSVTGAAIGQRGEQGVFERLWTRQRGGQRLLERAAPSATACRARRWTARTCRDRAAWAPTRGRRSTTTGRRGHRAASRLKGLWPHCGGALPELGGRLLPGQPRRHDRTARGRGRALARRIAHVGQQRNAPGSGQAHPGATGLQVAPAEHRLGRRRGLPPIERGGRAVQELVAVGGDDQRIARVLLERQRDQAHGTKTSRCRSPTIQAAEALAGSALDLALARVRHATGLVVGLHQRQRLVGAVAAPLRAVPRCRRGPAIGLASPREARRPPRSRPRRRPAARGSRRRAARRQPWPPVTRRPRAARRRAAHCGAAAAHRLRPRCSVPASSAASLTSTSARCASAQRRGIDDHARGLAGVGAVEHLLARLRSGIDIEHERAPLQRAAVLAARDDLLARIATLLEVHAADHFEVHHLRHELLDGGGHDARDAARHFEPGPGRGGQRGQGRGRGRCGQRQQVPRHALRIGQAHDRAPARRRHAAMPAPAPGHPARRWPRRPPGRTGRRRRWRRSACSWRAARTSTAASVWRATGRRCRPAAARRRRCARSRSWPAAAPWPSSSRPGGPPARRDAARPASAGRAGSWRHRRPARGSRPSRQGARRPAMHRDRVWFMRLIIMGRHEPSSVVG